MNSILSTTTFAIALLLSSTFAKTPKTPAPAPAPATGKVKTASKPVAAPPKTGSFTDSRNNRVYKTIVIGTQTWMAENLAFSSPQSSCYENQKRNCETSGRLYDWETAKTACPDGWHLPSDDEWTLLEKVFGGNDSAAHSLKSTSGWSGSGNGTNRSGFNALPAGYLGGNELFVNQGFSTQFWTASSKFGGGAWLRLMSYEDGHSVRTTGPKMLNLSVRCVKGGA